MLTPDATQLPIGGRLSRFGASLGRGALRMLGYDAARSSIRRKGPTGVLRSEDQELTPYDRAKLVSGARDVARNFTIAGWAIRKHLDYVSTFHFQSKTGDKARDQKIEAWMREWSKPANCDIAGRHSLRRIIRMAERGRSVDGDVFLVPLASGQIQPLEGDLIRTPPGGFPSGEPVTNYTHGVKVDDFGRAIAYSVCRRGRSNDFSTNAGQFYFARLLPAKSCWHHAYFDRFDQVRGVAPLAPAVNAFRDVYEGADYALAKMKVSQLFGLALYRDADDAIGNVTPGTSAAGAPEFTVDFNQGPQFFDLNKDERAEFLESKSPSAEFQSFAQTAIAMALKGFDIPYSFYSENFTNFSGQRQAWIQYDLSAAEKRCDNEALLDAITAWRLRLAILDGELPGIRIEDLKWKWVSVGIPWIDPLKEVQADTQAVASAFSSRTRVCRERGEDFFEIADEIAAENAYLEQLGLPTGIQPGNVQITEVANG